MFDLIIFIGILFLLYYTCYFLAWMLKEFEMFCKETVHDIKYAWFQSYKAKYDEEQRLLEFAQQERERENEETRKILGYGSCMTGGPDYV